MNAKVKKPAKKRAVRKKRTSKPPFMSGGLAAPAMPEASSKIKAQATTSKKSQPGNIYRKISVSFMVLTLVLVAAVIYFNFSNLTITIIPSQEKITQSMSVEVVRQSQDASLAPQQIFGVVQQVPVEQTQEFSASGKEILGAEITGQVTIFNNYSKNQPLVATTRLLADGKLYRLKNTVNVPAGGSVTAEIYADEAKPEMAVGPSKFTIPGLWAGIQDQIYAQNTEAIKYNEKVKYTISQSDIDNAVSQLNNSLLATAKNQVSQAYQDYAQSIFAVDNNSVVQEVDGKVGEEKDKFTVKMKVMVTVVAFNDNEIYDITKAKISETLADDQAVAEFNKQDVVYSLESFDVNQGTATVSVSATAKTTLKDDAKIIKKNNLAGLDAEQIKAYLNGLPEVAGYEIKFFPSFITKAPNLADRIRIEIKK